MSSADFTRRTPSNRAISDRSEPVQQQPPKDIPDFDQSYPAILESLPSVLSYSVARSDQGFTQPFLDQLHSIVRFGGLLGDSYDVAVDTLSHYLSGNGKAVFLNWNSIVRNQATYREITNGIATHWQEIFKDGMVPLALGDMVEVNDSLWRPMFRAQERNLRFALGTFTIAPVGNASATTVVNNSIANIQVTQQYELMDEYNWNNDPFFLHMDADPNTPGVHHIYFNAGSYWYQVYIDNSAVLGAGYLGTGFSIPQEAVLVQYPPDGINYGALRKDPNQNVVWNPQLDSIFGTPDHPNPLRIAQQEIGIVPGQYEDFYAGSFHQIEAQGDASTYSIRSEFQCDIVLETDQFSLSVSGTLVPKNPIITSVNCSSTIMGPNDGNIALLDSTNYRPQVFPVVAGRLHE
jgi:hypothetical protein